MNWGPHQTEHLAPVPSLLQNPDSLGEKGGFTVNYKVSDENYVHSSPPRKQINTLALHSGGEPQARGGIAPV